MHSKKLARIAIDNKKAIQKPKELSSLISYLKKRKLKTIVEIGTLKGGGLYVWCKISQPDALIVSIDLPHGPFGGGYTRNDIKIFLSYKKKGQSLYFLRKDSHLLSTKKELEKILDGRKIDFLMIDGDHRYTGVKRDFKLYSPLVKSNGLVVLHDILYHPRVKRCKVDKLWKEIKNNYKHVEFVDKKHNRGWGQWGGIGILHYKNYAGKRGF